MEQMEPYIVWVLSAVLILAVILVIYCLDSRDGSRRMELRRGVPMIQSRFPP